MNYASSIGSAPILQFIDTPTRTALQSTSSTLHYQLQHQLIHDLVHDLNDMKLSTPIFNESPRLLNIAHRGSSKGVVPNTIPAFLLALHAGAHCIEFDVQKCGSGELVLYHDLYLPNGMLLCECTLPNIRKELPRLDTLVELLDHVPVSTILYFDVKGEDVVPDLWHLLTRTVRATEWTADKFIMGCFDQRHLLAINELRKKENHELHDLTTAVIIDGTPVDLAVSLAKLQVQYVSTTLSACSADFVADILRNGMKIMVWTVNVVPVLIRLLQLGAVEGVVTDHPEMVTAVSQLIPRACKVTVDSRSPPNIREILTTYTHSPLHLYWNQIYGEAIGKKRSLLLSTLSDVYQTVERQDTLSESTRNSMREALHRSVISAETVLKNHLLHPTTIQKMKLDVTSPAGVQLKAFLAQELKTSQEHNDNWKCFPVEVHFLSQCLTDSK